MSDAIEIPGIRRFARKVTDHIRAGKNVVVLLPDPVPDRLEAVLRRECALAFHSRYWESIPYAEFENRDIAAALFERFASDAPPATFKRASALALQPGFCGYVVHVTGLPEKDWPHWKQFLSEYQDACRGVHAAERSLFCVFAAGSNALKPPPAGLSLAVEKWDGVMNFSDAYIYANTRVPETDAAEGRAEQHAATMVAACLGLWDFELIERLAALPLPAMQQPLALLRAFADERGWNAALDGTQAWAAGAMNRFEGRSQKHSALCALCGPDGLKTINRRIWEGQVRSLLPFVEEKRALIVERYRTSLTVPFETRFDTIHNVLDLELGHIEYQLSQKQSAAFARILPAVSALKSIRNSLAHMDPLEPEDLAKIRSLERFFASW